MNERSDQSPEARDGERVLFPEVVLRISEQKITGTLVTVANGIRRSFFFRDGSLLGVRSSEECEMFGSWLVERGHIADGQRALTLLRQGKASKGRLGEILVSNGHIDQQTLEQELRELWLALIARTASADDLSTELNSGGDGDQPDPLTEIPTFHLVLAAARANTNYAALSSVFGSPQQTVRLTENTKDLLAQIELTPTEGFVLSRISGEESIDNLVRLTSLSREQVVNALYGLHLIGAIDTSSTQSTPSQTPSINDTGTASIWRPENEDQKTSSINEEELEPARMSERKSIKELAEKLTRLDHYAALGIDPAAEHEEVDSALRAIRKQYSAIRLREHHLVDLKPQFDAILERAQEAHELLSNPRARRRYDRILESVTAEEDRIKKKPTRKKTDPGARRAIVEANFTRARELVAEGELHLAIKLLEHACGLEPRPSELVLLARLLLRNPLWTNRALGHLKLATEIDPMCTEAWIEIAEFWRRRSHPGRQKNALQKALGSDPDNERARTMFRQLVGRREFKQFISKIS